MKYHCTKCGNYRSPEEWIASTAKTLKINIEDVAPLSNSPYYICPVCNAGSLSTEITTLSHQTINLQAAR